MSSQIQIAYYYVSAQDAQRIDSFKSVSGDSEKSLVTQYVRGWVGRNRDYYDRLSRVDAKARGLSYQDWGRIVFSEGIEGLPEYTAEVTELPVNPLLSVEVPPSARKRAINYITLGKQNLAFLRVGVHYDRGNVINFVSRIVREHLQRNWETLYAPQVQAEDFENWR